MTDAAPAPESALESNTTFTIDVGIEHLPAELILLPDREPVKLIARVTLQHPLPGGVRERSRRLLWTADGGRIDDPKKETALLEPPEGSRTVTVRAALEIELELDGAPKNERVISIKKQAAMRLLAPAPSSMLKNGVIDGYTIGDYLDPLDPATYKNFNVKSQWPRKYAEKYSLPNYFYKVTPEIKGLKIAPHQTLGFHAIDFPWKSLGMPQYIALDLNLVRKLEDLREQMIANGFKINKFVPIYGFRPPAFNLGTIHSQMDTNLKEPFSMHQYGRAIDMIIDEDGDGRLDDLNHDGKIDVHDAAVIEKYVNMLDHRYVKEGRMEMVGGAGIYTRHDFVQRPIQSPYIHIDTRGFLEDDGTLVRWVSGETVDAAKKSPAAVKKKPAVKSAKKPTTASRNRSEKSQGKR